jgi:hypothetical protein
MKYKFINMTLDHPTG